MAQDKKNAKVGQSSPPYADSPNVTANGGTAGGRRHRARRKADKPRQERELCSAVCTIRYRGVFCSRC